MELIKWEPLKEMDRIFDRSFLTMPSLSSRMSFDLAIDLFEEKDNVIAKMTLPGIKTTDLDISIKDDVLTISGKREEEKEVDKKDYYSKEIHRGSFSRTLSLPKSVDAGKAEAKYENGELVVTMPIVAGAKERAVKVKVKE